MPSELGAFNSQHGGTRDAAYFEGFDNMITGTVPTEFGYISASTAHLHLYQNSITGSLPTQLGQLSNAALSVENLQVLLSSNSLCSDIPSEIAALTVAPYNSKWDTSNTFIGTPCCEALPAVDYTKIGYTCAPTPGPSSTQKPTKTLTAVPSPDPTLEPTELPVPSPTTAPTLVPTMAPTVTCERGEYYNSDSSACESCSIGRFWNYSEAPPYEADEGGDFCTLCPAGKYQDLEGQSNCTACPSGSTSYAARDGCGVCPAGQYQDSQDCKYCPEGTYGQVEGLDTCATCGAGSKTNEYEGATECTGCSAGRAATEGTAVDCDVCPEGTYAPKQSETCENCEAGTYSAEESGSCDTCEAGKRSRVRWSNCTECRPGKFAIAQSGSCTACSSGSYSSTWASSACVDCPSAKFAKNASSTECMDCPAGKFNPAKGSPSCNQCDEGKISTAASTSCTSCSGGKYSDPSKNNTNCEACVAGRYSQTADSSCTACDSGKFSAEESSSCTSCSSGKYSNSSASECDECPPGRITASNGRQECEDCDAGYHQPASGESVCKGCIDRHGPGYSSSEGATNCTLCEARYYRDSDDKCSGCLNDATCAAGTTTETLLVKPGYFRFSSTSEVIEECPYPANCVGGSNQSKLCLIGATGPLCTLCEPNYHLSEESVEGHCEPCSVETSWTGPIVAGCIFIVVFTLFCVGLYYKKDQLLKFEKDNKLKLKEFGSQCNSIFVTMQIVLLLESNHAEVGGTEMPNPYSGFLKTVGFLNLDVIQFVPFNCVYSDGFDHGKALVLECSVPLALFVLALSFSGWQTRRRMVAAVRAGVRNKEETNHTMTRFMQVLFLVLPTISRRICQTFRCVDYDVGEGSALHHSYLVVDYAVVCDQTSEEYRNMIIFASLMLLVYPIGVPLAVLTMLGRFRSRLDPKNLSEHDAIKQRQNDEVLRKEPIMTFALLYRPRYWWYEIYNMLRRLALTSMVLGCRTLAQTTVFVVAVSILTLVIERESEPFQNPFLSAFTYCMHWQIVLFVQFQLLLDAQMTSSAGAVMISILLLFTNLLMVVVVAIDTRTTKYRKDLAKKGSAFVLATTVLEESGVAPAMRRTLYRQSSSGRFDAADNPMYAAGAGVTTERVGAGGHELPGAEVEVKVDGADAANAPPAEKRSLDSPPLGTL